MAKYGIMVDGQLSIVPEGTSGAKPIRYEVVPEFDQVTQAVFQLYPVDAGDHIYIGVEIRDVEPDEFEGEEM